MKKKLPLLAFSVFVFVSCFSQVTLNKSEVFKQYPDLTRIEYLRLDNLPKDKNYQNYLIDKAKKELSELIRFQIFSDDSFCLVEYDESSGNFNVYEFISVLNTILDDRDAFEEALASCEIPNSNILFEAVRTDESLGGGDDCNNATAFCSDDTYVYNNKVNDNPVPTGPMYGCVCRLLNPSWFYMQIENSGDLIFQIKQTSGDVDFVCWGPFNNVTCDPSNIADFKRPDILDCVGYGTPNNWNGVGAGTIKDCAYSTEAEETLTINGALVGEYYLIAIANYSNNPGKITFSQTNLGDEAPGKTFCNAVSNCVLTSITTDVVCDASGATVSISGEINHSPFEDGGTGSIEICVGTVCQTITGPFSTTIPYVINGVPLTTSGSTAEIIATYTQLDGNSCFKLANFIMPDCATSVKADFTLSKVLCHDGTSAVTFTGICPAESVFNWDFGDAIVVSGQGQGPYELSFPSSGSKIISLNIEYQDESGNLVSKNATETIIIPDEMSSTISVKPSLCFGKKDGKANVVVSGGVAPYSYNWGSSSSSTSASANDLSSGMHNITITDANNCSHTNSFEIEKSEELISTLTLIESIKCFGQQASVEVKVEGGVAPYTGTGVFVVDKGEYSYEVIDANGCKSQTNKLTIDEPDKIVLTADIIEPIKCFGGQATIEVKAEGGVMPYTGTGQFVVDKGEYSYEVIDENGCKTQTNIVVIEEPKELVVSVAIIEEIKCAGKEAKIEVNAEGGLAPYTGTGQFYVKKGEYVYSVTDANGCTNEASILVPEPEGIIYILNLVEPIKCFGGQATVEVILKGGVEPYTGTGQFVVDKGVYTYPASDANGCKAEASIKISEPELLSAIVSLIEPIKCFGGQATIEVKAEGGVMPYTGTGQFIVDKGEYSYEVIDAKGCKSETDEMLIDEPLELSANIEITEAIKCFGELATLTVSATGGTPPYDNVGTYFVEAGSYSYRVVDSKGCFFDLSVDVVQPKKLIIRGNLVDNACFGDEKGKISLNVSGGTQPYSYSWNPSVGVDNSISNLANGIYMVSVIDKNSCEAEEVYTITSPDVLSMNYITTDILCYGMPQGKVKIVASGGNLPYEYKISTSQVTKNGNILDNLYAGEYLIRLVDANNCSVSSNVVINQAPEIVVSHEIQNPSCTGNNDGQISFEIVGGLPPYLFRWDNNTSDSEIISGLYSGKYNITVYDANNCEKIIKPEIILKDNPVDCLVVPNAFTPNGDGINDVWIIENLEMFPSAIVRVFNRWGQELWQGGANDNWDGTYKGNKVPCSTYTYTIVLYNGSDKFSGMVTIVY